MKLRYAAFALVALTLLFAAASVAENHVISAPSTATWGPAPPFIPAGAQIAVLSGDPGKSVPYVVRLRFPANYNIAAHSHPTNENVVVTSGTFYVGMGDRLDRSAGSALPVGGYFLAPTGMNHFAYTKEETTIVLYGVGPVEFKYVNPADDPRNAKPASK